MRHYCTFFDRNYLAKAVALLRSLEKHESQAYRVYVVCLDELTRVLLDKMRLPNIELIPLHEIEARDEALGKARRTRELIEYYWTLTPSVIYKILDSRPEIDMLTYLDADLFFYSSPDPIYREFGDASILIHGHRFSPSLKALEGNGKYNVGLVGFRRDSRGMTALKWWRDRCNEWCFWREEDGKMGDQKYLDDWPTRFEGVHVLEHVGAGLAPWNHDQYRFGGASPACTVDGRPLVFYHFHALAFAAPQVIIPAKHAHYPVTEDALRCCYLPYVSELSEAVSAIRSVHPTFDSGLTGPIDGNIAFMAQKSVWPQIDSAVPGQMHIDLDKEWRCYWLPNGRQAVRPSQGGTSTRPVPSKPVDYLSGDADMLCEMWPEGRPVESSDDLLKELSGRPITEDIRVLYIVGAHLFQERALLSRLFPNLENIYLFEPLDGARRELEKVAQTDKRLQVFKYAITDADGPIDFHVTDNNGESSSILPMGKHREIFPWVHDTGLVRVEGRTIGSIVREHHLRQPDMLFLDVQGAEYRILSAVPAGILSGTRLIYSEVSKEEIYSGSRPLNDIIQLLSPRFLFVGYAPLMRISPTHGNALFVNRNNAERLAQPLKPGWGSAKEIARNEEKGAKSAHGAPPLVTAIVSTYNSEAFIGECLEDLTRQTVADRMEIIVVDAASPQHERAVVEKFQKSHRNITYVRTGERIGVYAAWNLALRMAKGKYITPFSTNDRLRGDAYEILARALDDHPEVMLVYGDSYLTKTPHETFEKHTRSGEFRWPEYSYEDLLKYCMVGPHPMWRRAVHGEIGYFDERYVALGDQEFWLRMGERHRLLHIPEFTGLYWHSPEGLSNRPEITSSEDAGIRSMYRSGRRHSLARGGAAADSASRGRSEALDILDRLAIVDADYNGAFELRSRIEETGDGAGSNRPIRGNDEGTDRFAVSIIIPVFNKVEYTRKCLDALARNTSSRFPFETIIVDNASTDGTGEYLRGVSEEIVVVRNGRNLGFAKACNQGARLAAGRELVFLNNDTEPMPGWLEALLSASRSRRADICGAKLLYPNGKIQHAGVAIGPWKTGFHIFNGFPADDPAVNRCREFQAVTAACMLIRKSVFLELGGFDEAYRNGYEDVDLCLRARKNGRRILYVPESVLVHREGASEGRKIHEERNLAIFHERWDATIDIDCDRIYAEEGIRRIVSPDGAWTLLRDSKVKPPASGSPKSVGSAGEPVQDHRPDADDSASRGRTLKMEKRYAEAIEAFRQARSDGDLSVLAEIGDCLAQEGKLEEAAAAYREAVTVNPRDPRALAGLGVLDLVKGNPAGAAERFASVLETDERNATALCGMGLARKAGGGADEAFGWFCRALDVDPVNAAALHELIKGAHELGRLEETERYLSSYLQYKPADPHILFSLAGILYQSGKREEALDTLDRLVFFEPSYDGANELRERIASPLQGT